MKRLEEQGIIASVDQATDWVRNLVITEKKNGSIRVCLDPKPLNTAIKRERHMIPTPADVQRKLSGCKTFTVLPRPTVGGIILQVYIQYTLGQEAILTHAILRMPMRSCRNATKKHSATSTEFTSSLMI